MHLFNCPKQVVPSIFFGPLHLSIQLKNDPSLKKVVGAKNFREDQSLKIDLVYKKKI